MNRPSEELIYGNYSVLDPSGRLMFRCGEKKFNWYLKKGLADQVNDHIIRLNFTPNGLGYLDNHFYLQERINVCVVCGCEHSLSRHHVVPYCYRKHFPSIAKDHNYHDVLPLCTCCHSKYEKGPALEMRRILAQKYNAPLNPGEDKYRICKAASSLVRYSHRIPESRKNALKARVEAYLGREPTQSDLVELNKGVLTARKGESQMHAEVVMSKVENLQGFVEDWRRNFVETMAPKYMPEGWSVTADAFAGRACVRCDPV